MKNPKHRGADVSANEYARANLKLRAAAYERLLIHSVKEKMSAGEIVSRLIDEHLKRWSMPGDLSARGKVAARDVELDRQSNAGSISLEGEALAA